MHTTEIIWFLIWPVSIYLTYRVVLYVLHRYEKKMAGKNNEQPATES
jgi:hypothetical protein